MIRLHQHGALVLADPARVIAVVADWTGPKIGDPNHPTGCFVVLDTANTTGLWVDEDVETVEEALRAV